jgi:murein DD-endopeptidase MepM/ murein hydrolase activator NlpD
MRKLIVVVVAMAILGGVIYLAAGMGSPPVIQIDSPQKFVGASTPLKLTLTAPGGQLSSLLATFDQAGTVTALINQPSMPNPEGDTVRFGTTINRTAVAGLKSGPARITVTASRPGFLGLRQIRAEAVRDVQVRLEPPRVAVLSTHHYINVGGTEMIVYRAEPADVVSGVRVGDIEYPGFPATGARGEGVSVGDPALRVAFFALLYDQDPSTPMRVFARDEAGNQVEADFERRTFPKPTKVSRIELPDTFLDRVVPAILASTQEVSPQGSTLDKFLVINGELRRKNNEKIASFARETAPEMLWGGVVFHPFTNSAVQSAFADRRTYVYQGREVDHQTHLGFDLASYAGTPVVAANRGKVLFAGMLGIYGNTVILDHGMGVQSLYGHLSSIGVSAGAMVEKSQEIGRSGMTGMAAGDHLHYTMLVSGHMVNPIEWWDAHWIEDRILRKLREAR